VVIRARSVFTERRVRVTASRRAEERLSGGLRNGKRKCAMLKKDDIQVIERNLEWEKTRSYTDNGCNIRGNLIVARTKKAVVVHPRWGRFGAQCCLDVSDVARGVLRRAGIRFTEKLAIPDLVVDVSDEAWERFAVEVEAVGRNEDVDGQPLVPLCGIDCAFRR